MKQVFITTVLIAASFIRSSAQEDVSMARWQENKIEVDGHIGDWMQPFNLFDSKSGLIFTIANDKKNLYLCFTTKEVMKAQKIMKAGWTLELTSSEKKRKFEASLAFPKTEDPNIVLGGDYKNQVSYYKMNISTIEAKGFLSGNGSIPLVNANGITVAIGAENEQKIIYEIAIPLKQLMEEDKMQFSEIVTMDITVNGLTKPGGQSQPSASNGYSGGGGGRMGGGRGGRRGGGGATPQRNTAFDENASIYDKVSFKQKIRLVNK